MLHGVLNREAGGYVAAVLFQFLPGLDIGKLGIGPVEAGVFHGTDFTHTLGAANAEAGEIGGLVAEQVLPVLA